MIHPILDTGYIAFHVTQCITSCVKTYVLQERLPLTWGRTLRRSTLLMDGVSNAVLCQVCVDMSSKPGFYPPEQMLKPQNTQPDPGQYLSTAYMFMLGYLPCYMTCDTTVDSTTISDLVPESLLVQSYV